MELCRITKPAMSMRVRTPLIWAMQSIVRPHWTIGRLNWEPQACKTIDHQLWLMPLLIVLCSRLNPIDAEGQLGGRYPAELMSMLDSKCRCRAGKNNHLLCNSIQHKRFQLAMLKMCGSIDGATQALYFSQRWWRGGRRTRRPSELPLVEERSEAEGRSPTPL